MRVQLSMVGIQARDVQVSLAFYRLLGVPIPETDEPATFVSYRMASGVSLFFRRTAGGGSTAPNAGGPLLEFYVGEDAAVDEVYGRLTDAGHPGVMPPRRTAGPYAAMVADPDGNLVLLTSDANADSDPRTSSQSTQEGVRRGR